MLVAGNGATEWARRLFQESEGIDIDPAAGVALASLHDAVACGLIRRDAVVALNITGGGRERRRREWALHRVRPALHVRPSIRRDELLDRVAAL
jgi:cysteate synthase